eukprot:Cvel_29698.t1-p1 / transcript=Cvel_29698.t1 / gene=Cvel_29698 / organism=Chromera_velia_CCMP2878 / gene_product=hypothetical protein / transcript_product=hypothetical protein / location=Cvel_scaffold4114:1544-2726(+) / protein_length=369 / sequence_SO=supercontig / SO=protein_coding / is_pseudo=false
MAAPSTTGRVVKDRGGPPLTQSHPHIHEWNPSSHQLPPHTLAVDGTEHPGGPLPQHTEPQTANTLTVLPHQWPPLPSSKAPSVGTAPYCQPLQLRPQHPDPRLPFASSRPPTLRRVSPEAQQTHPQKFQVPSRQSPGTCTGTGRSSSKKKGRQSELHQPPYSCSGNLAVVPPSSTQPVEAPLLWQWGLGGGAGSQAFQHSPTYHPFWQQQQQCQPAAVAVPVQAAPVARPEPAASPAVAPVSAAAAAVGVGAGYPEMLPAVASVGSPNYLSSPAPASSSSLSDWIGPGPVTSGTSCQLVAGPQRSPSHLELNRTGGGSIVSGGGPTSSVTGASPLDPLHSRIPRRNAVLTLEVMTTGLNTPSAYWRQDK